MFEEIKDKIEVIGWAVAIVGYFFVKLMERLKRIKLKRRHDHAVRIGAELALKLNNFLWVALSVYKACRVFIIQYHNGEVYFTGQPVIRATMTHEVYLGVNSIRMDFDGVRVSSMGMNILLELEKEEFFYCRCVDDVESSNHDLFKLLTVNGVRSCIVIRIVDHRIGETVATLTLEFLQDDPLTKAQILQLLHHKKRIETIFANL